MSDTKKHYWFLGILVAGLVLRLLMPFRGYNFDIESYRIVAEIVANGGNVYAETDRYNYGPIWFFILRALDVLSDAGRSELLSLRWKVAVFLTIIDVLIAAILYRTYNLKVASLFFLNPISIVITGYHSQFDNLAILLGLLSVNAIDSGKSRRSNVLGLILLGISLSVKHILFIFPLWIAFRESRLSGKLLSLLIPYSIFAVGFLFYLPEGAAGILRNVFLYRSYNNAPFWDAFAPQSIYISIPAFLLFIATLLLLGLVWRRRILTDSLHLYLISLVIFSSAIANQYLAICVPSIATQWNWAYAAYTLTGTLFLAVDTSGLHLAGLRDFLGWDGMGGYYLLVALLLLGLIIKAFGKDGEGGDPVIRTIRAAITWLVNETRAQLKAPW